MTASTPRTAPRTVAGILHTVLALTALVAAPAPARGDAEQVGEPRFTWPLRPTPTVSRPFDAPAHPYGPGHRGVDLVPGTGRQALAAGQGYVLYAGMLAGRGVVSVEHDGGLRTTYEPVKPAVSAGEEVFEGQVIGEVAAGHAGCPAAVCLHWGVRRGEEYLDPLRLVRVDTRLRLKPWEGVSP